MQKNTRHADIRAVAQLAGSVTAALLTPDTHSHNDKYFLGAKPKFTQQNRKKKAVIFLPSKTTKHTNRCFINDIIENGQFKTLCILEKNLF